MGRRVLAMRMNSKKMFVVYQNVRQIVYMVIAGTLVKSNGVTVNQMRVDVSE